MGGQLIFDTPPLTDAFDVLGAPILKLDVSNDKPNAMLAVTLCEVFADGAATRISYGILNLTHRSSHEQLEPLEPGRRYSVTIALNDIGHRFTAGNRIRIAISNTYWPVVWPSPEINLLSLHCEGSSLSLPLRRPNDLDGTLRELPGPESAVPLLWTQIEPASNTWNVNFDAMTGTTVLTRHNDDGLHRVDATGMEINVRTEYTYTINYDDPLSARLETHYRRRYRRGDWSVSIETKIAMTSTKNDFLIDASLDASHGGEPVKSTTWSLRIPRDHV